VQVTRGVISWPSAAIPFARQDEYPPGLNPPRGFASRPLRNAPSRLISTSDHDVPMNAGGAQLGSTSLTFVDRRIFAPVAFGAQLCAGAAAAVNAARHAKAASIRNAARMGRGPPGMSVKSAPGWQSTMSA
jgi:hypothetical protein